MMLADVIRTISSVIPSSDVSRSVAMPLRECRKNVCPYREKWLCKKYAVILFVLLAQVEKHV